MGLRTYTLLWIFSSFFTAASSEQCGHLNVENYVVKNAVLRNHVFSRFKTNDVTECAKSCIKRRQCESINFDTKRRTCELSDHKYEGGKAMQLANQRMYSDISVWPNELDPDCFARSCNEDEVCVPGQLTGTRKCSYTCLSLNKNATLFDSVEFGASMYLFGVQALYYSEARELCGRVDGNLVQVDSEEELEYLKGYMMHRKLQPMSGYWNDLFQVGANRQELWRTTNDVPTVLDWHELQPDDNSNRTQSCTAFWKLLNYEQVDIQCVNSVNTEEVDDGRKCLALCEKPRH